MIYIVEIELHALMTPASALATFSIMRKLSGFDKLTGGHHLAFNPPYTHLKVFTLLRLKIKKHRRGDEDTLQCLL
jgi:hypothetical protein